MLEVERVALEIDGRMEAIVEAVKRSRKSLADQMERATESLGLNVAEGLGRTAGRPYHPNIAYASARELRFALLMAQGRRYIGEEKELMALMERLLGLIYGVQRKLTSGGSGARRSPADGR